MTYLQHLKYFYNWGVDMNIKIGYNSTYHLDVTPKIIKNSQMLHLNGN